MNLKEKLNEHPRLKGFIQTTQTRIIDSDMSNTSVVVAYYLLLSLFPLLIAVGNILPYLQINPEAVLPYVEEAMPVQIYDYLAPAIKDLLTQTSGSLLSVSALAALWSASRSVNALQVAMNKAYGVESRGNFIVVRLVSMVTILLFLIGLVGVFVMIGLGQVLLESLQPIFHVSSNFIHQFDALKWPATLIGLLVIMVLIYLIVPNAKVTIRSVVPGAVFATIGWLALSQLFGIYAKYFAARVSGYQIIGSFIVLLLWLNFAATIMILGGIINAVVAEATNSNGIEERSGILRQKWKHIMKNKRK